MKSRLAQIPKPPKHAPRIAGLEQESKGPTTKEVFNALKLRARAKVKPVTFYEGAADPVVIHASPVLTQTEELARLTGRRNARLVLSESMYAPHSVAIQKGINVLIANGAHDIENQAAVIMAKSKAEDVAKALAKFQKGNLEITEQVRLNLVAALTMPAAPSVAVNSPSSKSTSKRMFDQPAEAPKPKTYFEAVSNTKRAKTF